MLYFEEPPVAEILRHSSPLFTALTACHDSADRQLRLVHLQPRAAVGRDRSLAGTRGASQRSRSRSTRLPSKAHASDHFARPLHAQRGGISSTRSPVRWPVPILGVCLGHQAIGQATGGTIVRAKRLMHGKTDWIHHDNQVDCSPDSKTPCKPPAITAWSFSLTRCTRISSSRRGAITDGSRRSWAFASAVIPLFGLQFHPESFLTHSGVRLLEHFLEVPPARYQATPAGSACAK